MTTIRTLSSADIQKLFNRTAVGAERMLDDYFFASRQEPNFPPYDIEQTGEDEYRITLAVAGFTKEELSVSIDNGTLRVKGTHTQEAPKLEAETETPVYPVSIHKGIAKRDFDRSFKLMEYVVVSDVSLKDGLLVINFKRELPEALKPRTIEIG